MFISTSIASLHFPTCFSSVCNTPGSTSTLMAVTLKNQTCCTTPVQSIDSLQFLHGNLRLVLFLLSTLYFRTVSSIPYAVSQVSSLHAVKTSTHMTFQSTDFRQTATIFYPVFWSPARQLHRMLRSRKLQSLFHSLHILRRS